MGSGFIRNDMKGRLILKRIFCFLFLTLVFSGCDNSTETDKEKTYASYQENFLHFKDQFNPKNFIMLSPEGLPIQTTSLPESLLTNGKQTDIVEGDSGKPVRYQSLY